MPIITLLTDFGTEQEYVGVMKGVILSIYPSVNLVDLSHQVSPQDVRAGAMILSSAYGYFPKDTLHMAVVDPGVGTGRRIIGVEMFGHTFLAPDNGLLSPILEAGSIDIAVAVSNRDYFRNPVSRTFHGRDIFAPVGAYLSKGLDIRKLGDEIAPESLVRLPKSRPVISEDGKLWGHILGEDHFGNLITDITESILAKFCGQCPKERLKIRLGDLRWTGVGETYGGVGPKEPTALINSRGLLEIAVNQGSAARFFSIHPRDGEVYEINIEKPERNWDSIDGRRADRSTE